MTAKTSDWRPGPTVCRCCLSEGCYKDISTEYFWMGKREVYAEMLTDTLSVSIAFSNSSGPNSNSRLICEPCIARLRDAADFRRQVLECEKTFMQHLDPGSSSMQSELQLALQEVKIEKVKQEKRVSDDEDFDDRVDFVVENDDDDDDDDDDLDDQPLMKLATKVPKKEVDLIELIDTSQITVKRKATTASKVKEPPAKKAKKREIVIKPSASKPSASAPKTDKKKKDPATFTVKWRPVRKYNDERDNAAIILECSNVCPFKWKQGTFGCSYCTFTSADFGPIKEHVNDHPNKIEALRLARGATMKADVTDLKCELCLGNIKDIPTLVDHLVEVHSKPLDKKYSPGIVPFILNEKVFRCSVCDLTFDLFINLNKHLNEHYPNSVCSLCGKSFSHLTRLKAHILYTHEKERQMRCTCTKCGEVFTNIPDKNKHMMSKHGVMKHRCPYCNESFKSYPCRMKHMKEYHDKTVEYRCNMCSAVFLLCSQRTKHIQQVHIKDKRFACTVCAFRFVTAASLRNHMIKHGGERKHQCQVCKKAYARKKTLKEHMRIHNNDRRFICAHCDSAFVQNCSLKSHMRTHHPNAGLLPSGKL